MVMTSAEKSQRYRERHPDRVKETMHKHDAGRYAKNVAVGTCTKCKKRPARPGRTQCEVCGAKDSRASIDRVRATKERAIEYLGGACADCGLRTCVVDVYDFHHVNPSEKTSTIRDLRNRSWETIKAELDKCVLLCANCHRIREYRGHGRECVA